MNARNLSFLLIAALLFIAVVALFLIPHGFFGIPAAVGYAFCHQQPVRSLQISGYNAGFCYRCTGLFMGILLSVLWQLPGRKSAKVFSNGVILFGLSSAAFFIIDSLNSSFILPLFDLHPLYPDHPLLRSASGFAMGSACALIIFPMFIRLYAENPDVNSPPLKRRWQKIALILSLPVTLGWLVMKDKTMGIILNWVTAVSAILSLSVLYGMLLLVFGLGWAQDMKIWTKANRLLAGVLLALVQISAISYFRFQLTGSWGWPF